MKSILLIDAKDIEENISFIQKQIQILHNTSSSISHFENDLDNSQTNYFKTISTTA